MILIVAPTHQRAVDKARELGLSRGEYRELLPVRDASRVLMGRWFRPEDVHWADWAGCDPLPSDLWSMLAERTG